MRRNSHKSLPEAGPPSAEQVTRHKRKIFLLAVCNLLLATLGGCVKREITNIDSRGTNIICFGNSITFGTGVDASQSYPSVLARMLNLPIINAGVDGDTSSDALRRIDSDVLDKDPLLVIVEFGGNDFLRKIPLDETLRNIKEIIQKIHSCGAMVVLTDVSAGVIMSCYRKEYRRLSKKYNTIFIPHLLNDILTHPSLKSDSVHPNADGYKLIAQRVHQAIIPYLKPE